ncbi:hypothetical protein [Pyrococcus kukulkanii]|uniref:hypothetical protein n=1 Tax=Pyrococcus kukulkanii TaxID=1609559 RepID=UPI0035615A82
MRKVVALLVILTAVSFVLVESLTQVEQASKPCIALENSTSIVRVEKIYPIGQAVIVDDNTFKSVAVSRTVYYAPNGDAMASKNGVIYLYTCRVPQGPLSFTLTHEGNKLVFRASGIDFWFVGGTLVQVGFILFMLFFVEKIREINEIRFQR